MGSGSSLPSDKKIVIVGAGYAGSNLGVELMKAGANFTIVDAKDYHYHNVGGVRAVVEKDFVPRLCIPYVDTFKGHFRKGKVTSIESGEKKVILAEGEPLEYDVLIIAVGASGYQPYKYQLDNPDQAHLQALCNDIVTKVQNGKEFVVIGGGAVGVEVAAELACDYKDASVTLTHSNESLVHPALSGPQFTKFQKTVREKLNKMGVKLVLGEKVESGLEESGAYGPCDVVTDKGNTFHGDVVFRCTGLKVNSGAYQSLGSSVNSNGSLQVDESFQVKGHSDIFAIGDCTDIEEIKAITRCDEHVKVMKQNIKLMFNNQPLKKYDPGSVGFGLGVSLGRKDGCATLMSGTLIPAFIITMLKSKDMMVGKAWKGMRQKPPKL